MHEVEERVDRVEVELAQFIAQSKATIRHMDEMIERSDQRSAEMKGETDRSIANMKTETDRTIAKTKAETDRSIAEMRAETDRSIAEMKAETDRSIAKRHAETDRLIAEMKEESRKHNIEMAQIANRIGRFAEDFVNPNIPRVAREVFGIAQFEFEGQRVKRWQATDPGRSREFDCVIAGGKLLLISECKLTARAKDVDDFAASLEDIFDYFTEYRGYTLAPIYASLALSPDLVRRLTRVKIYAMALGERTMELLNLEQVRARRAGGH